MLLSAEYSCKSSSCRYCSLAAVICTFCISNATMGRFIITLYRIFYVKGHSSVQDIAKERQLFWALLSLSSFLNIITTASFCFDVYHRNFLYYTLCVRNSRIQEEVKGEEVIMHSFYFMGQNSNVYFVVPDLVHLTSLNSPHCNCHRNTWLCLNPP